MPQRRRDRAASFFSFVPPIDYDVAVDFAGFMQLRLEAT